MGRLPETSGRSKKSEGGHILESRKLGDIYLGIYFIYIYIYIIYI